MWRIYKKIDEAGRDLVLGGWLWVWDDVIAQLFVTGLVQIPRPLVFLQNCIAKLIPVNRTATATPRCLFIIIVGDWLWSAFVQFVFCAVGFNRTIVYFRHFHATKLKIILNEKWDQNIGSDCSSVEIVFQQISKVLYPPCHHQARQRRYCTQFSRFRLCFRLTSLIQQVSRI